MSSIAPSLSSISNDRSREGPGRREDFWDRYSQLRPVLGSPEASGRLLFELTSWRKWVATTRIGAQPGVYKSESCGTETITATNQQHVAWSMYRGRSARDFSSGSEDPVLQLRA